MEGWVSGEVSDISTLGASGSEWDDGDNDRAGSEEKNWIIMNESVKGLRREREIG
jgi:hypothetical protein